MIVQICNGITYGHPGKLPFFVRDKQENNGEKEKQLFHVTENTYLLLEKVMLHFPEEPCGIVAPAMHKTLPYFARLRKIKMSAWRMAF